MYDYIFLLLFPVNLEGVSRGSVGAQLTGGQCFVVALKNNRQICQQ